jgi:hypothetical protein
MNPEKVKYTCEKMLEVDWQPNLTGDAMLVLGKCASLLETMYLFGAIYFLESICRKTNNMAVGEFPIETHIAVHCGKSVEGIFFGGVWPLWYSEVGDDCGPQSILFVPQIEFGPNYHHDFGILYGDQNGTKENWKLRYGIEIDGYIMHRDRREKDKYRDNLISYPVIRLFEEIHNPLKWFKLVMEKDLDYFYEERCANHAIHTDPRSAGR